MDDGYCTKCEEPISFDNVIFTDCGECVCEECYEMHDCEICFPDEDESSYEPTESLESSKSSLDDPDPTGMDVESSSESEI